MSGSRVVEAALLAAGLIVAVAVVGSIWAPRVAELINF